MKPDQAKMFTCSVCHGTFEKNWSDAEALAEFKRVHPNVPAGEMREVCDPCYQMVMQWAEENGLPSGPVH